MIYFKLWIVTPLPERLSLGSAFVKQYIGLIKESAGHSYAQVITRHDRAETLT
jgi:hypothetical protein